MSKEDFRFNYPFRVRYSEIDGQKLVFFAHYLTYFDTAITEYLRWLPFDYTKHIEKTGYDFHAVRALVEYKSPIRFDEEIQVFVMTLKIGRSSLLFKVEIYANGEVQPRATGEITWVHTDQATGKSTPLNADMVALILQRGGGLSAPLSSKE